jgi:hypothetical protein
MTRLEKASRAVPGPATRRVKRASLPSPTGRGAGGEGIARAIRQEVEAEKINLKITRLSEFIRPDDCRLFL